MAAPDAREARIMGAYEETRIATAERIAREVLALCWWDRTLAEWTLQHAIGEMKILPGPCGEDPPGFGQAGEAAHG